MINKDTRVDDVTAGALASRAVIDIGGVAWRLVRDTP